MKLYTELDLIDLVQSLKDYTNESHNILGHDEREAKEFVDIFLKDRTPIEIPSDEEIEDEIQATNEGINAYWKIEGAKWMREQITKTKQS